MTIELFNARVLVSYKDNSARLELYDHIKVEDNGDITSLIYRGVQMAPTAIKKENLKWESLRVLGAVR